MAEYEAKTRAAKERGVHAWDNGTRHAARKEAAEQAKAAREEAKAAREEAKAAREGPTALRSKATPITAVVAPSDSGRHARLIADDKQLIGQYVTTHTKAIHYKGKKLETASTGVVQDFGHGWALVEREGGGHDAYFNGEKLPNTANAASFELLGHGCARDGLGNIWFQGKPMIIQNPHLAAKFEMLPDGWCRVNVQHSDPDKLHMNYFYRGEVVDGRACPWYRKEAPPVEVGDYAGAGAGGVLPSDGLRVGAYTTHGGALGQTYKVGKAFYKGKELEGASKHLEDLGDGWAVDQSKGLAWFHGEPIDLASFQNREKKTRLANFEVVGNGYAKCKAPDGVLGNAGREQVWYQGKLIADDSLIPGAKFEELDGGWCRLLASRSGEPSYQDTYFLRGEKADNGSACPYFMQKKDGPVDAGALRGRDGDGGAGVLVDDKRRIGEYHVVKGSDVGGGFNDRATQGGGTGAVYYKGKKIVGAAGTGFEAAEDGWGKNLEHRKLYFHGQEVKLTRDRGFVDADSVGDRAVRTLKAEGGGWASDGAGSVWYDGKCLFYQKQHHADRFQKLSDGWSRIGDGSRGVHDVYFFRGVRVEHDQAKGSPWYGKPQARTQTETHV